MVVRSACRTKKEKRVCEIPGQGVKSTVDKLWAKDETVIWKPSKHKLGVCIERSIRMASMGEDSAVDDLRMHCILLMSEGVTHEAGNHRKRSRTGLRLVK